jgi:hypothetical protein
MMSRNYRRRDGFESLSLRQPTPRLRLAGQKICGANFTGNLGLLTFTLRKVEVKSLIVMSISL